MWPRLVLVRLWVLFPHVGLDGEILCGQASLFFDGSGTQREQWEVLTKMSNLHFRSVDRRRTVRASMCVNVLAYGEVAEGEKFRYWTRTVSVSEHGGAIELDEPLPLSQVFQVMNEFNGRKALAKIVFVRKAKDGRMYAAFEFVGGGENFWSMAFPMVGAKPLRRKA
jgi:PilZ domain-containing protein